MLFSSIPFLYYFLPITLALYFLAPRKIKNGVLLLVSLVFYAWGEPRYVFLMAGSILIGYVLGIGIEKHRGTGRGRALTALSVVLSLGFLAYFKYANFFLSSFHAATGIDVPLLNIALPIGISFYTFQLLSYTIDVARGDVPAQRNLVNLAAYITMFPQLIAGPIVRYSDIAEQLDTREHTLQGAALGIRRFLIGLGKKVLIANTLGALCADYLASPDPSVLFTWLYAIGFALQIYYDFSGYSDMAIGLGHLFGFRFPENFDYPYISGSVTEFWRRWHMTLGSWFRDYLYIPLGGNRVKKARWLLNILVVWMATGLWHGAAWNFVLWGLFFAVWLVLEKLFLLKALEKIGFLRHIYTLLLVLISFVLFNAESLPQAVRQVGMLFGAGADVCSAESLFFLKNYAIILAVACIGATPVVKTLVTRFANTRAGTRAMVILEPIVLLALLLLVTASLVSGSFNPFLYFRF